MASRTRIAEAQSYRRFSIVVYWKRVLGKYAGEVVCPGSIAKMKRSKSLTAKYLFGT